MKRRHLAWLAALALLLALAAATTYGTLRTERGLRWIARGAQALGGGRIGVGEVQGRLLGESQIRDFHYQSPDGLTVDIRRLVLKLDPRDLLRGRLHVERLDAQGVAVQLGAAVPPAQDVPPPRLASVLPLDLVVDAATIAGADLRGPQMQPLHLDRVELAGTWIGDRIEVARLATALPQTGPLHLKARARLRVDRIELAESALTGPGEITAAGVVGIGDVPSELDLRWRDLHWPLLPDAAPPPVAAAGGELKLSGPFAGYRYELQAQAVVRNVPARLAAHGDGSLAQLRIADLALGAGQGAAHAQGAVAWQPALHADLQAQFENLDPALLAAGWSGTLNGSLRTQTQLVRGEPQIAFELAIDRSTLRGQPLALSAAGSAGATGARLEKILLQAGGGSIAASGDLAWAPALAADLDATIARLNPAALLPQWPGELNGQVQIRTARAAGAPDLKFTVRLDHSQLRGYPLMLSARGDWRDPALTLDELLLSCGATRIKASGRVTPPLDFAGRIDSHDLAALYPELAGRVQADFSARGPLADPHLVTRGSASGLRFMRYRVGKLDWNADVDPQAPSTLGVVIADADLGLAMPRASLAIQGRETYHVLKLDAATARGDLSVKLAGGYDRVRREWGGHLESARIAPRDLAPWTLEKSAPLLLGAQRQSVEPACLSGVDGRACLRLEQNVTGQGLRLYWDLEKLRLAAFTPLLPAGTAVEGEASGDGYVEIAGGDVAAIQVGMKLGSSRLLHEGLPPLAILPSTLTADQDNGRLHAVLDLHLAQGTVLADVAADPAANFQARALSGRIRIDVPDLAFVEQLSRELRGVGGHIGGELVLGGTAGLPRLRGEVALADGRAKLATPGITLEQVQLRLSGGGEGPLAIEGSMQSGGGSLRLAGTVDPARAPPHADLSLKGDGFQAVATPDARVWVTPDLHLVSDDGGIRLDGSLTVPRADITPKNLGNEGVPISADQVLVGAEPRPDRTPLKIFTEVRVALGDAVAFKGFGLTTRLEGAVALYDEPERATRATGELRLAGGRYKAYGQELAIETGRLIFAGGPVTRPAVDFYATRHPQADVTVGVRVRGTLDQPQLTLQSDPAMPREQQLSWLVLGRPLDQSSASDRSAVSQAALSLGLSGGEVLAQRLGKGIGLDQVMVGAGPVGGSAVAADAGAIQGSQASRNRGAYTYTTQAAQLTLGKYLTPKLFVSYGVSLFQPGQTFRLLYDLGGGFKLQTESGVASGGDLIYTFER